METSWADQWDYSNPDPVPGNTKSKSGGGGGGGAASKYGKKMGEGLGKTKVVASNGLKKVKTGTSLGLQWVKEKYQKTTQKH